MYACHNKLSKHILLSQTQQVPDLDGHLHVLFVEQRMIDAQDDPVKQGAIQGLSHGVTRSHSLTEKITNHLQNIGAIYKRGQ